MLLNEVCMGGKEEEALGVFPLRAVSLDGKEGEGGGSQSRQSRRAYKSIFCEICGCRHTWSSFSLHCLPCAARLFFSPVSVGFMSLTKVSIVKDGSGNEVDKCSNKGERERVKTPMFSDEDYVQERETSRG